jgi:deoxyribodipyrimidine photo-lyase
VQPYNLTQISNYEERDFPAVDDFLSVTAFAIWYGKCSKMVNGLLIRCRFFKRIDLAGIFMQILFNFPREVTNNFKPAYDGIQWLNNEDDFKRWCSELLDINQWWTLECVNLRNRLYAQ